MAETEVQRAATRPLRCLHHPGVAGMATCDVCGASLCLACAVPVRGTAVGPECLGRILDTDAPPPAPPPAPALPRTDILAVAGFGLVVVLSFLPWSRFGDSSGSLDAWTVHWSLVSVGAALVGLVAAVQSWRRPGSPRTVVVLQLGLALLVGVGATLHYWRPPPLSSSSPVPLLALAGAALAATSGGAKAVAAARLRRPPRSP